ncbi:MAG: hypothetical protein AB7N65_23685, partial [Vicinamibacterales bacterium]
MGLVFHVAAYLAALELGQLTRSAGGLPLLPAATGILWFALARSSTRQRARVAASALVGTLAWASLRGIPLTDAAGQAVANVLGAAAGVSVLIRAGVDTRSVRTIRDTWWLLVAAAVTAVSAATLNLLPALYRGETVALLALWHGYVVTGLLAILFLTPLALVGGPALAAVIRSRSVAVAALVVAQVIATHFFWASSDAPRPALLAPTY